MEDTKLRKTFVLGTVMLALVTLSALMPVVKAVAYYWDGIQFVDGIYIKYPHPDRDYYEISPYSDWSKKGDELYHTQFNHDKSLAIGGSLAVVGAAMGAAIGAIIGGTYGAVIGTVTGAFLGFVLTWYAGVVFLDEYSCIWWWISTLFMDWLIVNQVVLGIMCIINPSGAQTTIAEAFVDNGYLRVGAVTFADHIGVGDPYVYTLTISTDSGGTTDPTPGSYVYTEGTSVEVTAVPSSGHRLDYWILDGVEDDNNPITVTMNSDRNLTAYFSLWGGGCPTLFVWSGTDYADEGILDIHADSDVTVRHEIENPLGLEDGGYRIQLRELDNFTSHIDQVRLYAVDDGGEEYLCPLTHAYHSELDNVKHTLQFDDDTRVDLKPTEIIDLRFGPPECQIEHFIFEINGYNLKPLEEAW